MTAQSKERTKILVGRAARVASASILSLGIAGLLSLAALFVGAAQAGAQ